MARSIWNGVISFGLVSIPVGLQTATSEKDLRFNQLHRECGTRIKQQKFCPTCNRVVDGEEIDRGYEVSKNQYVIVTDEDFETAVQLRDEIAQVKSRWDHPRPSLWSSSRTGPPSWSCPRPFG